MLFECSKLISERNSFTSAMLMTHGKWTYNTQILIKEYTKEFIDYMKSIELDRIQDQRNNVNTTNHKDKLKTIRKHKPQPLATALVGPDGPVVPLDPRLGVSNPVGVDGIF